MDLRPIAAIAFPAILTQLATPIGQAYVTRAMAEYGEEAVAGMAIVGRLTPIAFGVIFALSGAIGPIIGQNAGAGQMDRVRQAFREGLLFTALVVVVMSALLFVLRPFWVFLFQLDGAALTIVFLFAGPLSLAFFFNGVIFVGNAAFNNLGHPYYSTWINWGRHTLGTIPFVIIGAAWFGAPGVLIGQAAGGVVFAAATWLLARKVLGDDGPKGPAEPYAREARLHRLLHLRLLLGRHRFLIVAANGRDYLWVWCNLASFFEGSFVFECSLLVACSHPRLVQYLSIIGEYLERHGVPHVFGEPHEPANSLLWLS